MNRLITSIETLNPSYLLFLSSHFLFLSSSSFFLQRRKLKKGMVGQGIGMWPQSNAEQRDHNSGGVVRQFKPGSLRASPADYLNPLHILFLGSGG